jgi:Putative Ig domain
VHNRTFMKKMLFAALVSCLSLFGFSGCNDISKAPAPAPSTNTSPGVSGPLSISTSSLPAATVGLAYTATVVGSGGTPPYTWLVTPLLPTGLTLDATTGAITGSPSAGTIGTTGHTFVLQDAAFQSVTTILTLTVNAASLAIATTSLPTGTVNQMYPATTLVATGGIPPYVWSVNPALPNGLVLNVLSPGTISGVPLAGSNGTASHTFTVTDSAIPIHQTSSTTLSLTINLTVTPVTITTSSLPNGQVGQPYSFTLQGSGGTLPYSWSVMPALPHNLTLNASTGTITGTPTATSNVSLSFTLRDSTAPLNQASIRLFTLQVTN